MIAVNRKLGRKDHGRRMSLRDFEFRPMEEGCAAELSRGYVIVGELPNYSHAIVVATLMEALFHFKREHPGTIHAVLGGESSKLLIPAWESERHPDLAVYLSPPKGKKDRTLWRTWIPELVVEVVSTSSDSRDYTEKRDEYLTLGVKEYWIVDAKREQIVTLRRGRSKWNETVLGPSAILETKLLPGFQLPCQPIFTAAADGLDEE